jgi:prolipoprotein diacylglyceryltransferase
LTHVLVNWEYFAERAWAALALTQGGLSFHGGWLAGLAGLAFFAWRHRQPGDNLARGLHVWLAALTPALAVGLISGWLACLLGGCAYGQAIPPPQRFYTPDWPDLYGVSAYRLPSQLLGLLAATTLLATIGVWQRRPGLLLVVYGVGDFLIAFTRGDLTVTWGPLWLVQWADLALIVIGLLIDALGRRALPIPVDSVNT